MTKPKNFCGFKMIKMTKAQIMKLLTLKPDEMLTYLEGIDEQQSKEFNGIREMLGEDNTCDCPSCNEVKICTQEREAYLKRNPPFPDLPDFLKDLFNTFEQTLEVERKDIKSKQNAQDEKQGDEVTEAESDFNDQMPEWASHRADRENLEEMTQLCTRDGRVTGNAVIFKIVVNTFTHKPLFHCITDAGNIISLSFNELIELFHEPQWVMKDFPNNSDDHIDERLQEFVEERYGPFNHY